MLVPDYNNGYVIVQEGGAGGWGSNAIRDYWRRWHAGIGPDISGHKTELYWRLNSTPYPDSPNIGTYFTWTAPKPGYVRAGANFDMAFYYNTDKSKLPNEISFWAGIRYSPTQAVIFYEARYNSTVNWYKQGDLYPVSKGDVIAWGVDYKDNGVPAEYSIVFYPGKPVDVKTGDDVTN